jgi:hypothetical protein
MCQHVHLAPARGHDATSFSDEKSYSHHSPTGKSGENSWHACLCLDCCLRAACRPVRWLLVRRQFHCARSARTGESALSDGLDSSHLSTPNRSVPAKEAPGSIVVDSHGPFVYYVLPGGKAIRYGATVGEAGQAWSGVARLGVSKNGRVWTPTADERRRLGPLPKHVEGGARNPWAHAPCIFTPVARTRRIAFMAPTSPNTWTYNFVGLHPRDHEDAIDLYDRAEIGTTVVVL